MAKKKGNIFGKTVVYEKKLKGTSQGRITKSSKVKTMNKHKRKGRTKKQLRYRGQGQMKENATDVKLEFICREIKELKTETKSLRADINRGKGGLWILLILASLVTGAYNYFK